MLASVVSPFAFGPPDVPPPAPDTPPLTAPALVPALPVLGVFALDEVLSSDGALPMGTLGPGTPVGPAFGEDAGWLLRGSVLLLGMNGKPVAEAEAPVSAPATGRVVAPLPKSLVSTVGPEGAPGSGAVFLKVPDANVSTAATALPKVPLYWPDSKGTQPPFLQTPRLRSRSVEHRTPSRSVDRTMEGISKKLILMHR